MKKKTIAIIGAGLTGLTAGYRLSQRGYKVEILEKSENVGGLMGGFEINGTNLEKAYHHIFKTDHHIIDLINELGLGSKLTWNNSSIGIYHKGRIQPFVTPIELLKFKGINLLGKIRLGLVALWLQRDKDWRKYIEIPAYKWMLRWCGENAYKVIWEPLLKGKFHDYYKQVSMAWLWARIHTRGNSKEKGDSNEKLGYLIGGFDQISRELVKRIKKNGGEIKLNEQLSSIPKEKYDRVIATVPTDVFSKLSGVDYPKIDYLGAVLIVFSSKQSLSEYYWHNINDLKSPFLAFIQHTNLIGKENYKGHHIYYMGTYVPHDHRFFQSNDSDLTKEFFDYLLKIFPNFDQEKIKETFVFKLKNAQHVVDTKYPTKIPEYKTSLENVYLSNFSQIFPEDRGTNFAVGEGEKIVRLIENSF